MANELVQFEKNGNRVFPNVSAPIYNASPTQGGTAKWYRIGSMVRVFGSSSKPYDSWTLFNGLPIPRNTCIVGVVGTNDIISHPLWITQDGYLQLRNSAHYTETFIFDITYTAQD